jgi:mannose-1-phosphate guanylyltransferase
MKAILLAAGLGTRLRPLTDVIPKCLVPINGRPLLEYWIKYLTKAGITSILVNVHYLAESVKRYIEESDFSIPIKIVYEETLLMTGGTLLKNRNFAGNAPVMLIHADNICFCDFKRFMAQHTSRPKGTEITMMTFFTDTPQTCGIVELNGRGIVQKFHEKVQNPPGNLANGAVYIVEPSVIDFIESLGKKEVDFSTEVLPHFMGRINTFQNKTYHKDIGNLGNLLEAQLEYPEEAFIPGCKDHWSAYINPKTAKRIFNSLAESLHFEILFIDTKNIKQAIRFFKHHSRNNDSLLIVFERFPCNLNEIMDTIQPYITDSFSLLLGFQYVPHCFSSREVFESSGIRSFALCSSYSEQD